MTRQIEIVSFLGGMPKLVSILSLFGGLLLLTQCTAANVTYYVSPEGHGCPEGPEPCYTIEDYISNDADFFSSDQVNVTMNFLTGTHAIVSGKDFNISGLNRLSVVGTSSNVVIKSTTSQPPTWSIEADNFYAKNLTIIEVTIVFQVKVLNIQSVIFRRKCTIQIEQLPQDDIASFVDAEVTECTFTEQSFIQMTKSNITLKDCKFINIDVPTSSSPLTIYKSKVNLSGVSNITGNYHSAISATSSEVIVSGIVDFFNNTGENGGALALYSSTMNIENAATVSFVNNRALNFGGAIFVSTGTKLSSYLFSHLPCFYQITQPSNSTSFNISFTNNTAGSGGHDIYGASLKRDCQVSPIKSLNFNAQKYFHLNTHSLSSVSSSPLRVCVCKNGVPQCLSVYESRTVYPGETITIPIVVVGGDFGTTTGTVYVRYVNHSGSPYNQVVTDFTKCTNVSLKIYSLNTSSSLTVYLSIFPFDSSIELYYPNKDKDRDHYKGKNNISFALLTTPVFFDITFLHCPQPLYLTEHVINCQYHREDTFFCRTGINYHCNCLTFEYNSYYKYVCESKIEDGNAGIHISSGWIGVGNKIGTVLYSDTCPLYYCKNKYTYYNNDIHLTKLDEQCVSNRTGTLCGGCQKGYSLTIGSSSCKYCPNNNRLALIIFFAAAGFFLVFLITILNLTVTQGMINGLIVYANIVWTIRSIFTSQDTLFSYYSLILAWLNLDFGIETCFVQGLDAYWKTWLQFVFPFYTAGLFFVGLRFSSKLSKLFGDRAVPTLATLMFMSYSKLLRTIIATLNLSTINIVSTTSNSTVPVSVPVWSLDGNVHYGEWKHLLLVLFALACLLLLWLPYTLLLLLMQCLRKTSNSRVSRWITRYKPVFDAYYAPLNDKHHYWFGVLLLATAVILLFISLTSNSIAFTYLYIILIITVTTLLLFYMNFKQVYRVRSVLVTESLFLMNIILLIVGFLTLPYFARNMYFISVTLAYIELFGILISTIFWTFYPKCKKYRASRKATKTSSEEKKRSSESGVTYSYVRFRDSILLDTYKDDDK